MEDDGQISEVMNFVYHATIEVEELNKSMPIIRHAKDCAGTLSEFNAQLLRQQDQDIEIKEKEITRLRIAVATGRC